MWSYAIVPEDGWLYWKDFTGPLVHPNDKSIQIGILVIKSAEGQTWVEKGQVVYIDTMEVKYKPGLQGIERRVGHLLELVLKHNELNPSNIVVGGDDNSVIIDFDSCKPEGDVIGLKGKWTVGKKTSSPL